MGISSGVVRYDFRTSDGWLKQLLKMSVYMVGEVNSSGCRGITLGTEVNNCRRSLGGCVGMDGSNGAVDEKNLGILNFSDRINCVLVILVGCAFDEVHGVTRYGENHKFGDNFWYPGSV